MRGDLGARILRNAGFLGITGGVGGKWGEPPAWDIGIGAEWKW